MPKSRPLFAILDRDAILFITHTQTMRLDLSRLRDAVARIRRADALQRLAAHLSEEPTR